MFWAGRSLHVSLFRWIELKTCYCMTSCRWYQSAFLNSRWNECPCLPTNIGYGWLAHPQEEQVSMSLWNFLLWAYLNVILNILEFLKTAVVHLKEKASTFFPAPLRDHNQTPICVSQLDVPHQYVQMFRKKRRYEGFNWLGNVMPAWRRSTRREAV